MKKIAIYGKGGIGKSTIVSNIAVAAAQMGLKVLQIGCDPKADSTFGVRHRENLPAVLKVMREQGMNFVLDDVIMEGYGGVICAETGGPVPGQGCAGRGVITALEKLESKGIYEIYQPDLVLYDVLGDVVCGGFSMPMRHGYADQVYIVTSGENMSIYAAANIATAVKSFEERGYATLGGFILNRRNVKREDEKVAELCEDFDTKLIGDIPRTEIVTDAEDMGQTVMEAFGDSDIADKYRELAKRIIGDA